MTGEWTEKAVSPWPLSGDRCEQVGTHWAPVVCPALLGALGDGAAHTAAPGMLTISKKQARRQLNHPPVADEGGKGHTPRAGACGVGGGQEAPVGEQCEDRRRPGTLAGAGEGA